MTADGDKRTPLSLADAVLNSQAADQLLADVDRLSREINEGQDRIAEARAEAGVAPGEALIGPPVIPLEWRGMPSGQETRVVDPNTGAAKGSKLARFDLLPWDALSALAEHYGRGTWKYADRNWEGGYAWSLSFAALQRHLIAHWQGEVYDLDPYLYGVDDAGNPTMTPEEIAALPDSEKVLHITAVMWHAAALAAFFIRGIGTDDRPV